MYEDSLSEKDTLCQIEPNTDKNVLKSIVNTKTVGLKSRVTYMVGESLAEIKRNGIEWNNGNSGIYRLLFFALSLLMVVLLPIISLGFGMTWDEPDNVRYAEDILKYFFYRLYILL